MGITRTELFKCRVLGAPNRMHANPFFCTRPAGDCRALKLPPSARAAVFFPRIHLVGRTPPRQHQITRIAHNPENKPTISSHPGLGLSRAITLCQKPLSQPTINIHLHKNSVPRPISLRVGASFPPPLPPLHSRHSFSFSITSSFYNSRSITPSLHLNPSARFTPSPVLDPKDGLPTKTYPRYSQRGSTWQGSEGLHPDHVTGPLVCAVPDR